MTTHIDGPDRVTSEPVTSEEPKTNGKKVIPAATSDAMIIMNDVYRRVKTRLAINTRDYLNESDIKWDKIREDEKRQRDEELRKRIATKSAAENK